MKVLQLSIGLVAGIAVGVAVMHCPMVKGCCKKTTCAPEPKACEKMCKKGKEKGMKVDNAKFYKDGKFDAAAATQAYFDLMKKFNYPVYEALQDASVTKPGLGFWAVDFAQGDFASFGMGGVIFVNEREEGYFGHDIYLLPFQSIAEHSHVATKDAAGDIPGKTESWLVRAGWVYSFSEIGEPNLDKFPEAKAALAKVQVPNLKSVHVEKWTPNGVAHKLPKLGSWHFMMGGDEGAIVSEYATFHDGNGLRFSVPGVAF